MSSGDVVSVLPRTTRVVGTVNSDSFLTKHDQPGGPGAPAPDTGYAVTTLVQLSPGSGVVVAVAVHRDQGVVGDPVRSPPR